MGFLGDVLGWSALASGVSVGDSLKIGMGFSGDPLRETISGPIGNVIDNSALGQAINDSLGSSKSTENKEKALRNTEMNYNSSEAQKNRDWQEHMRDTYLTSAFNQARENGINPYAMFSGGSVSSPGGSAASYSGYASSALSAQVSRYVSRLSLVNSAINAIGGLGRALIYSS